MQHRVLYFLELNENECALLTWVLQRSALEVDVWLGVGLLKNERMGEDMFWIALLFSELQRKQHVYYVCLGRLVSKPHVHTTWSVSLLLGAFRSHDIPRFMLYDSTRLGLVSKCWVYKPPSSRESFSSIHQHGISLLQNITWERFMSLSGFSFRKSQPLVACLLLRLCLFKTENRVPTSRPLAPLLQRYQCASYVLTKYWDTTKVKGACAMSFWELSLETQNQSVCWRHGWNWSASLLKKWMLGYSNTWWSTLRETG
jgi:hypothetical protein